MQRHSHVIAVDGSKYSDLAFQFADRNFSPYDEFVLVHGRQTWKMYTPGTSYREYDQKQIEESSRIEKKYMDLCKQYDRKCEFHDLGVMMSPSQLSTNISSFAQRLNASSIVLGARGLSTTQRLLAGSVSNGVLHDATVPVVVVKPQKTGKQK